MRVAKISQSSFFVSKFRLWVSVATSALALLVVVPCARPQEAVVTPHPPVAVQDARDARGLTRLIVAAQAGETSTVRMLLASGADVNATDAGGRTALIAAVQNHQGETAKALVAAGANLNIESRFGGSALLVAENSDDIPMAAWLLASGAHSTGKSVGDTVCVRSWGGDGYCGTVQSFTVRAVKIAVTKIVGCEGGCPAHEECSTVNGVGGRNGLHAGEQLAVPSWCLTLTGVKQ